MSNLTMTDLFCGAGDAGTVEGGRVSRLRLLDLYCCQGGAMVGYERAGWEVYGVDSDHTHQRYYPAPFHHGSALAALSTLLAGARIAFTRLDGTAEHLGLGDFDAIHASPPCQKLTRGNAGRVTSHVNLIPATRELLLLTGLPYVIENVEDAGPHLRDPALLCGTQFNLGAPDEDGLPLILTRHRLFETNWALPQPPHGDTKHRDVTGYIAGVYGGARGRKPGATAAQHRHDAKYVRRGGYVPANVEVRRALLGIDWPTTRKALEECIPPAYAEHVGSHLAKHVVTHDCAPVQAQKGAA